jgi:NCAIR mutase (PurE)-related proteins
MPLEDILRAVKDGSLEPAEAARKIKSSGYEDLGFAKLDFQREARRKFGETIYCPGKTESQLALIFKAFADRKRPVLGSRATKAQAEYVRSQGVDAQYDEVSRLLVLRPEAQSGGGGVEGRGGGIVAVCTGGTADLPVAEEAAQTAEFFGATAQRHYDVGVAGLHRLLAKIDEIRKASAIIAIAGMEGALGSVVAGLVERPVIAVPTSVGYGAAFGGVAPLLSMLNSCAEGMSVVNIDNGYGAGYLAAQIARMGTGE